LPGLVYLNEITIFALPFEGVFFLTRISSESNNLNIELCQAVKKERDTRWLRISVKRDLEKTVTRRRSNSLVISTSELSGCAY